MRGWGGIEDHFCFVHLDFDLYQPTIEGLKYFYPRMVSGGIILLHDYFSKGLKGVKQAVSDYSKKYSDLRLFPIGDGMCIAIYC
jgi:hypothetical protein